MMRIRRQDETQLVIEVDLMQHLFGRNFIIAVSLFLLFSLFALFNDPSSAGFQILFFTAICAFIVLISGEEVFHCILDKKTNVVILVVRAPWFLWFPRQKTVLSKDIKEVVLLKKGRDNVKIYLYTYLGQTYQFANLGDAKIAEAISSFLEIPFHIEIDNERITQIPQGSIEKSNIIPTPCISCGAPLPKIDPNSHNIKCTHCGMTMVIQWQDGKLSYRKANEFGV